MKTAVLGVLILSLFTATLGILPAYAQESSAPLSDTHIARIRSNCRYTIGTLSQIRVNDAPIYINHNQTYFSVSDKLMARLNSRLTLNRYDATDLVQIASKYNAALIKFRETYKDYSDAMDGLVRIDCNQQPTQFYNKVGDTRALRQKVNDSVVELKGLIDQYQAAVQAFKEQHATQLVGDNQ